MTRLSSARSGSSYWKTASGFFFASRYAALDPAHRYFRNPCHAWSRNFSRIVFLIVF